MVIVRWMVRGLLWAVILAAVAALAVGVVVPRVAGATPFTILTGSMAPQYPPGTLVVDHAADPDEVGVGTVVTYQLRSGEPEVVTHRVIEVRTDMTGERRFITQGDANDTPDTAPVRPEQIRGQLWYAVPHLGRLSSAFSGHARETAVNVLAVGLAVYAGLMLAGFARDRRRVRRGPAGRHVADADRPADRPTRRTSTTV